MSGARNFTDYHAALVLCYEEEVGGEAYFNRLGEMFAGRGGQAMSLIGRTEVLVQDTLRPLLAKYRLAPGDEAAIRAGGRAEADGKTGTTWQELVEEMVERFPTFVQEFQQIERLAPAEDLWAMKILTWHEVAAVDFARLEAAGDPSSLEPLNAFIRAVER